MTLSNYMAALSSCWKQNKHVELNLLKSGAKCIPGVYRPQTTWLYVNRTLGNSGSLILPYNANVFVALEMSLHRKSTWSWFFRH